jgi:hypothetical protein
MITARTFLLLGALTAQAAQAGLAQPGASTVPRYEVFEYALTTTTKFENPFTDVRVSAEFKSPTGRSLVVPGFYYGDTKWMVRLAPDQLGEWSFQVQLTGKGESIRRSGSFRCVPSKRRGFVRISKQNPYRLAFDDGSPFYPIGVQTCGYFQVDLDGPSADGTWKAVPAATWVKAFEGATNLARWQLSAGTKKGCALPLIPVGGPPDRYDTHLARQMDELLVLQRAHGFSHLMVLFQDMSLWGKDTTSFGSVDDLVGYKSIAAPNLALQDAYIRYVVARFGSFVDIWELFNEDSYAPSDYLAHLAAVVREADPYKHPVTTNYARSTEKWCEMVTWHAYMGIPAGQVDGWLAAQIGKYKAYGKPVLNTEFGNRGSLSNVDPVKWRIAVWAAYMNESNILFWGMSGRKTPGGVPRGNSNAYLGADSRQHFRVFNDFTRDLPIDLRPVDASYSAQSDLRVHAMANGKTAVVYVHHFADHTTPYAEVQRIYVHTGPGSFRATWIDPATGVTVKTVKAQTRGQYAFFEMPPVTIDLACRLDRED